MRYHQVYFSIFSFAYLCVCVFVYFINHIGKCVTVKPKLFSITKYAFSSHIAFRFIGSQSSLHNKTQIPFHNHRRTRETRSQVFFLAHALFDEIAQRNFSLNLFQTNLTNNQYVLDLI